MSVKKILLTFLVLIVIALMVTYWFFPFGVTQFKMTMNSNFNFTVGNASDNPGFYSPNSNMQFYPNMRYPTSNISYHIDSNCSLLRKTEMNDALAFVENLTVLHFYPVASNPEISITCNNQVVPAGNGAFVAGEGGPVQIIAGSNFDVIEKGEVLLLRDSSCPRPNIEIHELMHALGFAHSKNPNNIMYPVSDCSQNLGTDIPDRIDELYSFPSEPDLALSNVSASISGRYLDMNLTVKNIGLANATEGNLSIYADNGKVKEINISRLGIGESLGIELTNILVTNLKTNKLKVSVETNQSELSLDNNNVTLTALQN